MTLIEEADVFLNSRGQREADLDRGALLSVPLRVLECSNNAEAAIQLLLAMQLVLPIGAELTHATSRHNPLDTSSVANLPEVFDVVTDSNYHARIFVAGDALCSIHHGDAEICPLIVEE